MNLLVFGNIVFAIWLRYTGFLNCFLVIDLVTTIGTRTWKNSKCQINDRLNDPESQRFVNSTFGSARRLMHLTSYWKTSNEPQTQPDPPIRQGQMCTKWLQKNFANWTLQHCTKNLVLQHTSAHGDKIQQNVKGNCVTIQGFLDYRRVNNFIFIQRTRLQCHIFNATNLQLKVVKNHV